MKQIKECVFSVQKLTSSPKKSGITSIIAQHLLFPYLIRINDV